MRVTIEKVIENYKLRIPPTVYYELIADIRNEELEIAGPLIANTLSMLRQDLLDRLSEEKSTYHISDVGVGLEIAIKIIEEYEEQLK